MAFCLLACGDESSSKQDATKEMNFESSENVLSSSQDGSTHQANDTVISVNIDWNPAIIQRQILVDEDAICGVIFLGYVEESVT